MAGVNEMARILLQDEFIAMEDDVDIVGAVLGGFDAQEMAVMEDGIGKFYRICSICRV
jgi:hypothetical protein